MPARNWREVRAEAVALGRVRELHKPITEATWWFRTPGEPTECTRCSCGSVRWPCETAKSIYPPEELERLGVASEVDFRRTYEAERDRWAEVTDRLGD